MEFLPMKFIWIYLQLENLKSNIQVVELIFP